MDQEVITRLERILVLEPVDDDYHDLRVLTARVGRTPDSPVVVDLSWSFHRNTGEFSRPFAPDEVRMLTGPTTDEAALAFATWVRTELVEHISELIAAGEIRSR